MTTNTNNFKKGDKVIIIRDWDRNGTVHAIKATVYSCGKKRMVLNRRDSDECLGRNFLPQTEQSSFGRVIADATDAEAEIIAVEIAEAIIACQLISGIRSLFRSEAPGFNAIVSREIAALKPANVSWQ